MRATVGARVVHAFRALSVFAVISGIHLPIRRSASITFAPRRTVTLLAVSRTWFRRSPSLAFISGGRYHGQAGVEVLSVGLALVRDSVSHRAPSGHPVVANGHLHAPGAEASSNNPAGGFPSGREPRRSGRRPSSSHRLPRSSRVQGDSLGTRNAAVVGPLGRARRNRGRKALRSTHLPVRRRQRRPVTFFSPRILRGLQKPACIESRQRTTRTHP